MTTPGRKPTRTQGRGEIAADRIYPLATFLKRLGIGRSTFVALRKRGLPIRSLDKQGRRVFLDGREVVEFLRRLWQADRDQRIGDAQADAGNRGGNGAAVPGTVPEGQL